MRSPLPRNRWEITFAAAAGLASNRSFQDLEFLGLSQSVLNWGEHGGR